MPPTTASRTVPPALASDRLRAGVVSFAIAVRDFWVGYWDRPIGC